MNKLQFSIAILALCGSVANAAMTVDTPKRSPSTGEAGNAILTDEGARRLQLVGAIFPDANGATALNSHVVPGQISQVTGKEEPARYRLASGVEIPLIALAGINTSTHATQPLALPAGSVALGGDLSGTAAAAVVATVGLSSAANVHSAELAANAAVSTNTASTIVKRDGSGNFSAGVISASLTGNVTGNASGSAASFTGSLAGDVSGTQGSTSVALVGGASAANVAAASAFAIVQKAIVPIADLASGGDIGSAAATVDVGSVFNCTQTTAAQTLTLPSPTVAGNARVVYLYNSGSQAFTFLGNVIATGAAAGALWNGSAWVAL